MALIQHRFFSSALTECNALSIICPVEKYGAKKLPVCWLMSPLGTDYTGWYRNTSIEKLAEKGYFIVIPDMKLSFGLNMAHGFRYFDMLTKELPSMIMNTYSADIEHQIIAGALEGAYVALHAAISGNIHYEKIIMLSAGSITDEESLPELNKEIKNAFGTLHIKNTDFYDPDVLYNSDSEIFLAYSDMDRYSFSSMKIEKLLERKNNFHLMKYDDAMNWAEWQEVLETIL